ncbi:MAG: AAA family ATPase [Terriglobales bacterium]
MPASLTTPAEAGNDAPRFRFQRERVVSMPLHLSILALSEAERRQLESAALATRKVLLAGAPLPLPQPFHTQCEAALGLRQQAPQAVLLALPAASAAGDAFALVSWLRADMPSTRILLVGPLDPPQLILQAMRSGAHEYLDTPLRPEAIDEALVRAAATIETADAGVGLRPATRGKLIAVLGARGGCGATTTAVNLALGMHLERRAADRGVALIDAAPLGHAALHLNLKPQFTLADLIANAQRLDESMLASLMLRHDSGLQVLAGPAEPLASTDPAALTAAIELLLRLYPWVVLDLSARLDALTRAALELSDRILFVTQTDMVSLWSAAKVRQYLDPAGHLRFEMVLNRFTATPAADLPQVAAITRAPLLWKLPNAHQLLSDAIEHGQPPVLRHKSEIARSFRELARAILGRAPKPRRSWLPLFRFRPAPAPAPNQ